MWFLIQFNDTFVNKLGPTFSENNTDFPEKIAKNLTCKKNNFLFYIANKVERRDKNSFHLDLEVELEFLILKRLWFPEKYH